MLQDMKAVQEVDCPLQKEDKVLPWLSELLWFARGSVHTLSF